MNYNGSWKQIKYNDFPYTFEGERVLWVMDTTSQEGCSTNLADQETYQHFPFPFHDQHGHSVRCLLHETCHDAVGLFHYSVWAM